MSKQSDALARLERIARIRSDIELRRFSAFRQHVEAARGRVASIECELQSLYAREGEFSVAESRLVNALAQDHSRALMRAEHELNHILPGYEAAREKARREFGRLEVLKSLREAGMAETRWRAAKNHAADD